MRDILITLGSNIDPETNIPAAIRALDARFGVLARSGCYRTKAINASGEANTEQADFINAAVSIVDPGLDVESLRAALREIEATLGRVRTRDKFAPRTIDLDIAVFGDKIILDQHGKIKVPDPDIFTKAHVALPLAEIAPDLLIPGNNMTLKRIGVGFTPLKKVKCDEKSALD